VAHYAQPQAERPFGNQFRPRFQAGVTHEADVVALDASIGGQMAATNTMVLACSSLQPADVQAWAGIYQAWQALHADWLAWKAQQDAIPSIDLIGQAAALAVDGQYLTKYNAGTQGQSFTQWAMAYQTRAAAACPGIQPPVQPNPPAPPGPNNPNNPNPPDGGIGFGTVALIVIGAGVLAVGAAWLAPVVLGAFAAHRALEAV
jgi:hypothetical protein